MMVCVDDRAHTHTHTHTHTFHTDTHTHTHTHTAALRDGEPTKHSLIPLVFVLLK